VLKEAGSTFGLSFSPDGRRLATSNSEGIAAIWDVATGQQILSLFGHTRPVFAVTFTPNGSHLATASGDGTVKIWDANSGEEILTLLGHTGSVFGVTISPDGTRLATAGEDGISRVYSLKIEDLVKLAQPRLTRSLSVEECQKYLHLQICPPPP
jgi:WD40 repeat protein